MPPKPDRFAKYKSSHDTYLSDLFILVFSDSYVQTLALH